MSSSARTPRAASSSSAMPAGLATHVLAAVMLLCAVLFLAWVRVASLHLGYELGRLRAKQDALVQERAALKVELATLRSPARLAETASRLGMVPVQSTTAVNPSAAGRP